MNVLFHLATGFGIALAVCPDNVELREPQPPNYLQSKGSSEGTLHSNRKTNSRITAIAGTFIAFVAHGLLDYAPHCYPINSKADFIIGFLLLISLSFFAKGNYKTIVFCTLLGSVLPDIIDLLPSILNSQLGIKLPVYEKLFPWHWKRYSGSIYNGDCSTSNINIALIVLSVLLIVVSKFELVKRMYFRNLN